MDRRWPRPRANSALRRWNELADRNAKAFRTHVGRSIGIGYDYFIRTTEARHVPAVYDIFRRLSRFRRDLQSQLHERVLHHVTKRSSNRSRARRELSQRAEIPRQRLTEENYFFHLGAFQDKLLKLYDDQPDFIRPRIASQ